MYPTVKGGREGVDVGTLLGVQVPVKQQQDVWGDHGLNLRLRRLPVALSVVNITWVCDKIDNSL